MDTQETNLPMDEIVAAEDAGKLEESQAPEISPVDELESVTEVSEDSEIENSNASDEEVLSEAESLSSLSKEELVERLKLAVLEPEKYARNIVDEIKQAYNKIRREENEVKRKEFLDEGGEESEPVVLDDETDTLVKNLIVEYREKRTYLAIEEEKQKENNLILKQHLIERLKVLTESQDDFNKRYNEFREIQRKWKEIKAVPHEYQKELNRSYQLYNERFYDLIRINAQFRDYDFKKNLELKTALCETVERLSEESDTVSSFHQLQKLHSQWREIGPVAKEFRESIWERFKAASAVINKRHQSYFEGIKAQEEANYAKKAAICEELEAIDFEALRTMREWDKKTNEVIELQAKWRTIGFATKKYNVKVFERFRAACDNYFQKKAEFYKTIKHEFDKNLALKKELVAKAEAIKDSTDWKETTKMFVELQSEWKKIGPVSHKHSDMVWKQFIAACDYYFDRKDKGMSSQKSEENKNLAAKKEIIKKINAIDADLDSDTALALLKEYIAEWNSIGYVPFKEKDKLHRAFREATDKQFDHLKISDRDRRLQQFRSNISEIASSGKSGKLYGERDKLMRTYERMKSELQTYENNIGFVNISSKEGDGLMKDMDRKIARLKDDMGVIIKKIETIDENLE